MSASQTVHLARGGKSLYGAPLGILMLDARFPRIPGDMGNAQTWPFPVLYRVVRGASPEKVVLQAGLGTLDAFVDTALTLSTRGPRPSPPTAGFWHCFSRNCQHA